MYNDQNDPNTKAENPYNDEIRLDDSNELTTEPDTSFLAVTKGRRCL